MFGWECCELFQFRVLWRQKISFEMVGGESVNLFRNPENGREVKCINKALITGTHSSMGKVRFEKSDNVCDFWGTLHRDARV